MLIEKLISPIVPMLLPSDTGNRALSLMEENHLFHLPVVQEEKYLALVKENELLGWNMPESPLSMGEFMNYKPAVFVSGHPYEALRIATEFNLDIVPVIDNVNNYLGAITKNDLLKFLTENGSLNNPGGIIILEIKPNNYSLSEIARICENEDVLITGTQLRSNTETGLLEITLKTNRTDISALINSLERHDYIIKEMFGIQNDSEDIENRYKLLMNYINM